MDIILGIINGTVKLNLSVLLVLLILAGILLVGTFDTGVLAARILLVIARHLRFHRRRFRAVARALRAELFTWWPRRGSDGKKKSDDEASKR